MDAVEYIAEIVDEITGERKRITVLRPEPEVVNDKIVVKERRVWHGQRLFPTGWRVQYAKPQRTAI